MEQFLVGHARGTDWAGAAEAVLDQLGAVNGANLGFLYATDDISEHLGSILALFRERTGIAHWVGTVGMGVCAPDQEYYDEPAIVAMVGAFPEHAFRLVSAIEGQSVGTRDGRPWRDLGAQHLAVLHGDPRNPHVPALVERMPQLVANAFVVGGLTASRRKHYQLADEVQEGQLSGVVFSDAVPVITGLTQGCSPIGPAREVTDAQRNIAIRIDQRPALDVLYEDIGEILARDLNRAAGYIFAALPVQGADRADYLVRNLVGVDLTNKLVAIGDHLEPGSPIMFCRRDGQTAKEDMERMLADLKRRLPGPPRGGLYFSCVGRGRSLFGDQSEEMKMITAALGEFPLVGFYANGEISGSRLYAYTGVLSLFV